MLTSTQIASMPPNRCTNIRGALHLGRLWLIRTGAAVDLIGARDLHHKDSQRKMSEPIHFCTANGTTKAETIVQSYSPALEEQVSPHVLSDSVSALSTGKRIASGCEFHWMPKKDDKVGTRILIEPDGKRNEFKVNEHDVPYLMEQRETTAHLASIDNTISMVMPAAAPTSQPAEDPQEKGQGGPWLAEDDRAARNSKLRTGR